MPTSDRPGAAAGSYPAVAGTDRLLGGDRTCVTLPFARYSAALDPSPGAVGLGPWETACAEQGVSGRTDTVLVERRPAEAAVALALRIPERAVVVYRRRHMMAGTQVAQISESFIPLALVEGTPLARPEKVVGGVYRAFAALGRPPATTTERITARMPTPDEAETLSLDMGAPVMTVLRTTAAEDGTPLEMLRVTCAGDRVDLLYEDLPLRR